MHSAFILLFSIESNIGLQVQKLLKRLETPYSEDAELQKAIFPEKKSTESSCTSHQTPVLFNSSDVHEMYPDKPPDDALNMRLT